MIISFELYFAISSLLPVSRWINLLLSNTPLINLNMLIFSNTDRLHLYTFADTSLHRSCFNKSTQQCGLKVGGFSAGIPWSRSGPGGAAAARRHRGGPAGRGRENPAGPGCPPGPHWLCAHPAEPGGVAMHHHDSPRTNRSPPCRLVELESKLVWWAVSSIGKYVLKGPVCKKFGLIDDFCSGKKLTCCL